MEKNSRCRVPRMWEHESKSPPRFSLLHVGLPIFHSEFEAHGNSKGLMSSSIRCLMKSDGIRCNIAAQWFVWWIWNKGVFKTGTDTIKWMSKCFICCQNRNKWKSISEITGLWFHRHLRITSSYEQIIMCVITISSALWKLNKKSTPEKLFLHLFIVYFVLKLQMIYCSDIWVEN